MVFAVQVSAQNSVETLFENKEYSKVITVLTKKEAKDALTLRDYYLLTKSFGRTQQYSNGLVYSNTMIKKSVEKKDTTNLLIGFNLKAENLIDLGGYEDGIIFCEKASELFRPKDSVAFQNLCFKWGMMYHHNKQYEKAYETYNQITLPKYRALYLFTNNYALTLMGMRKWEEALVYLKKSLTLNKNLIDSTQLNVIYSNISTVLMNQERWEEAEVYLDSAAVSVIDGTSFRNQKNIFENYFELYKGQGRIDDAMVYFDRIRELNEGIFKIRIEEKIKSLEISNQREDQLKETIRRSEKQTLWGTIAALVALLGFISTIFFFKYKNIKSAHEKTITEQQLLRSQMTPHFIFNSLSVIQGMVLNNEDNKAVKYLSKFSRLLRLILESSREKHVAVKEELLALKSYVELQNMSRLVPFVYSLEIDESVDEELILIPPMLIQPFIENAIEHGFKEQVDNPEISVQLLTRKNVLICTIKDNGIGINATKNTVKSHKKSLATKITSERLKILSKNFKVDSSLVLEDREKYNEKGTQVILKIPFKKEI